MNSRPQDVITTPKIKNRANKKYKPKEAEGTIESMDDNSDTEKKEIKRSLNLIYLTASDSKDHNKDSMKMYAYNDTDMTKGSKNSTWNTNIEEAFYKFKTV